MLLIPVLLQICFLIGIIFFGAVFVIGAAIALAQPGSAYAAIIESVGFLSGTVDLTQLPAAFASREELLNTIIQGVFTWQSAVVALLGAIFTGATLFATSYTKALTLGIVQDARAYKKTRIVDVFRAGRAYLKPTIISYTPYFMILFLLALIMIPTTIYMLGTFMMYSEEQPWPAAFWFIIVCCVLLLLYKVSTMFIDARIADGSKTPIRDAFRYSKKNPARVITTAIILGVVTIIFLFLKSAIDSIEPSTRGTLFLLNLVAIALFFLWRLWVVSFVVSLGSEKNPVVHAPQRE